MVACHGYFYSRMTLDTLWGYNVPCGYLYSTESYINELHPKGGKLLKDNHFNVNISKGFVYV